jgi:hypothetical protein
MKCRFTYAFDSKKDKNICVIFFRNFRNFSKLWDFWVATQKKNPIISKNFENRKIHIWSKTYFFWGVVIFFEFKKIKKILKIGIFDTFYFYFSTSPTSLKSPTSGNHDNTGVLI